MRFLLSTSFLGTWTSSDPHPNKRPLSSNQSILLSRLRIIVITIVVGMHGDAEKINSSLKLPLGVIGTRLQLSVPGECARRIERYTRTVTEHSNATLSALPYILPAKYTLPLHKAVASSLNDSINSRSAPQTPRQIVTGQDSFPSIAFGRCAMVTQPPDKRQSLALAHLIPANQVPKFELGVSMGPDHLTKQTLFLLANGLIVPRRVGTIPTLARRISTILPKHFVPFNWIPKPFHLHVSLQPETSTIAEIPINFDTPLNSVVQLPDAPTSDAISALTNHLPTVLPINTLASVALSVQYRPPYRCTSSASFRCRHPLASYLGRHYCRK